MKDILALNWEGPHHLPDFIRDRGLEQQFSCPGVYLWIDKLTFSDRLSYVGKASGNPSLSQRQRQHYVHTIGGLYTIPLEYRHSTENWIPDWSIPEVAEIMLDQKKYHQIVEEGFTYTQNCEVYLAKLKSLEVTKRVERQLLYDLKPSGTKWGTKTPPGNPVTIIHNNATWASNIDKEKLRHGIRLG